MGEGPVRGKFLVCLLGFSNAQITVVLSYLNGHISVLLHSR